MEYEDRSDNTNTTSHIEALRKYVESIDTQITGWVVVAMQGDAERAVMAAHGECPSVDQMAEWLATLYERDEADLD